MLGKKMEYERRREEIIELKKYQSKHSHSLVKTKKYKQFKKTLTNSYKQIIQGITTILFYKK